MNKISAHLDFHAQALALRSSRNEVLASNIANAATPNFKARDLDFDKEISKVSRMNPQAADYPVHLNYLELLTELPWDNFSTDNFDLPVFL